MPSSSGTQTSRTGVAGGRAGTHTGGSGKRGFCGLHSDTGGRHALRDGTSAWKRPKRGPRLRKWAQEGEPPTK